jgi:hypothetical protein
VSRQDPAVRADRAAWAAAVARQPLDVATRLVAGRATGDGRVRVAAADLSASCCLSATATATSNDLAGQRLLARDGGALVLTFSAGRWSP